MLLLVRGSQTRLSRLQVAQNITILEKGQDLGPRAHKGEDFVKDTPWQ